MREKPRPPTSGAQIPDAADRAAAIHERERNVLIDAGAGTGKTTILVARLVELVAPSDDRETEIPIERVAAVTFTRKAAGELRLRIRERLLATLAGRDLSATRRARLQAALQGLDTATIGTIHGFADRLLRLRPMEAGISPQYEILDEIDGLIEETTEALIHGAEREGLETFLTTAPPEVRARAGEAAETVRLYLEAGLPAREKVFAHAVRGGLDSLVHGFVEHRDQPPAPVDLVEPDLAACRKAGLQFVAAAAALDGASSGARLLRERGQRVAVIIEDTSAVRMFAELRLCLRKPQVFGLKNDCDGDRAAWAVWKTLTEPGKDGGEPSLMTKMLAPLQQWMANRLVRLFPVVVALYERCKTRHQVLDQTDLLLELRNVLRDHADVREQLQGVYQHILVDEFQDTDPLQAEILAYLCATSVTGATWTDVKLRPGSLTLVGDPKQSIYRFRRADVATYDQAHALVAGGFHLRARLSTNFRSQPALIYFFNDRFARLLGEAPPDGRLFDDKTGIVFHQPLRSGRAGDRAPRAYVRALPLVTADPKETKVDDYRALEGAALARYLRWLLEKSGLEVIDVDDGKKRPLRHGDIAVLAFSTLTLSFLFRALDQMGVPYASRGGVLFLSDPLHRQFLLGLRALSDRDDGPAQAALLRPPFFAVDLAELLRARADQDDSDPRAAPAREARALVAELRRRRFERPPGVTARDLLETTAFARHVVLGPNGVERLARLRELCLQVDRIAADESLDFDAVTTRLRSWVDHPVPLDPPRPVGGGAVQVLTVHQSKGLEWPVVVLWDGCAQLPDQEHSPVWRTADEGKAWFLKIDGLQWERPPDGGLLAKEIELQNAERKRLVYVAATRARDLLVIATPEGKIGPFISSALLKDAPDALVEKLAPYTDVGAAWSAGISAPTPVPVDGAASPLEQSLETRWVAAVAESGQPRLRPRGVSSEAHPVSPQVRGDGDGDGEPTPAPALRTSRFGTVFGDTVHRAIGMVLRGQPGGAAEAIRRTAAITGLVEHHAEAAEDVVRAITALEGLGIRAPITASVRLEYPVAGPKDEDLLLIGYADLVHAEGGVVTVIDFKTDTPPGPSGASPAYIDQVRSYARLVGALKSATTIRAGLLFTGDGQLHWAPASGRS
jgi:ATP-dependent exoDNAse (exonuclease V) beta subunit